MSRSKDNLKIQSDLNDQVAEALDPNEKLYDSFPEGERKEIPLEEAKSVSLNLFPEKRDVYHFGFQGRF
jgi:hypothetical protein